MGGGAGAPRRGPKGRGFADASPPHSALMAAGLTGRRGGGGGVAPEEPTATDTKKWDGGSLPKGPPADACHARRQAEARGGAQGAGARARRLFRPGHAANCASGGGGDGKGEKPIKALAVMASARAYR